ncbi:hypothetical protein [Sagittula sp.]|uniref:Acb2/Tad1 domain-containing protein n=1 Tax=Sagittula sp. TaxID=2038081 RepID=UPI003517E341
MTEFKSTDDKRTENSGTRAKYRTLTDREKAYIDDIKQAGDRLIDRFYALQHDKPEAGREFALATTHVEDAVMRAVRGITQ